MKNYYMGCPSWGNKDWIGSLFARGTSPKSMLMHYSNVFNTVEGNTTFYALPNASTVQRWIEESADDFKFTFKFPRTISHDLKLRHCQGEVNQFLQLIEPIGSKIGQLWLQLPPNFSFQHFQQLKQFIAALPKEFEICIEVRHLDFYDEGDKENQWQDFLITEAINWVHFDTAALFELNADEPSIIDAQKKKPNMPTRFTATGKNPFLRFIAGNDPEHCQQRIEIVAHQVSQWIELGKTPYIMIHTPNCIYCPETARVFHDKLAEKVTVGTLTDWNEQHKPDQEQMDLF